MCIRDRARRLRVLWAGQRMVRLVRVFAADMAERDAGKTLGDLFGQLGGGHEVAFSGVAQRIRNAIRRGVM